MPIDLPPPIQPPLILDQQVERVNGSAVSCFLTYAHADDRFVDSVNSLLKEVGVETYVDHEFIEVGRFDDQIIAKLKRVTYQVIFATKASNASEICKKEIDFAKAIGVKQIPIILDPIAEMDWFHFHLAKEMSIMVDEIEDPEVILLAIRKQLSRLLKLEFVLGPNEGR